MAPHAPDELQGASEASKGSTGIQKLSDEIHGRFSEDSEAFEKF